MENTEQVMPTAATFSLFGFLLGAAALIFVVFHFVSGPFAPQPDTATSLGELASGMAKAAARDLVGISQPAPEVASWDIDRILRGGAVVIAGLAIVLGVLGIARGEGSNMAWAAVTMGTGAIATALFTQIVLIIACTLVLMAFFAMIGSWSPFG